LPGRRIFLAESVHDAKNNQAVRQRASSSATATVLDANSYRRRYLHFERTAGVVPPSRIDAEQQAARRRALAGGKKIVYVPLQTFPVGPQPLSWPPRR
jgi:hypothetical protein